MKRFSWLLGLLAILLFAAACEKHETTTTGQAIDKKNAVERPAQVGEAYPGDVERRKGPDRVAVDNREAANADQEEYLADIETELDVLQTRLDHLKDRARMAADSEDRDVLSQTARNLESDMQRLSLRLDEMSKASREQWEEARVKLEASLEELRKGFQRAAEEWETS